LRGRIERVMDAAKAEGYHPGPNPALWRGNLKSILPKKPKLSRGHHAALPYDEMPAFWQKLVALDSVSANALRFLILTAARSGEVRLATWNEIDMQGAAWNVPAERMKAGKPHRVPLTDEALAVLITMSKLRAGRGDDDLVFPARDSRKPLSVMALAMALRGINDAVTVHGFRSSFRDWAAEQTSYPGDVAEAALAHTIGNKVEAAYRRGDLFEKRRALMAEWAQYVSGRPSDNVVRLDARRA